MGVFPYTRNKDVLPQLELLCKFKFNSYLQADLGAEPFDKVVELKEYNISYNWHFFKIGL